LWRINEDTFRFRVLNKQFVGLDGVTVVAVSNNSIDSVTFNIVKESNNSSRVRLRASNGNFLQVILCVFIWFKKIDIKRLLQLLTRIVMNNCTISDRP